MPNWCEISLVITSENEQALNKLYLDNKTEDNELDFNCVCPCPSELMNSEAPNNIDDEQKQELIDKYGYPDWYSWCCNNWGTKWNASDVECSHSDTQLTYTFNTAWGPPSQWFTKLTEKYNNFDMRLEFEEPGMDFAGFMDYTDEVLVEESYPLSDHVWENCDHGMVNNIIEKVINDESNNDVDDLCSLVIEELCDDIYNAHSLYNKIFELITEYLENKESVNVSYEESILHYDDKGSNIENLNL